MAQITLRLRLSPWRLMVFRAALVVLPAFFRAGLLPGRWIYPLGETLGRLVVAGSKMIVR